MKSIWMAPGKSLIFMIVGLIGLPIGAHLIVTSGSVTAREFGVSETIGLILLAVGTSQLDLAATSVAAIRGHAGVALGNVLGSCLINRLATIGITVLIVPIPLSQALLSFDLWSSWRQRLMLLPPSLRRRTICRPLTVCFLVGYFFFRGDCFRPMAQRSDRVA